MRIFKLLLALALMVQSTAGMAAWYFIGSPTGGDFRGKAISDEAKVFDLDGILCEVSATSFNRHNDQIIESRRLLCQITNDASVSTIVTCNLPLFEMSNMSITVKGRGYFPILSCGPTTK